VQQTPDPAATLKQRERSELTAQWMDTAMRPDIHPAPAQHGLTPRARAVLARLDMLPKLPLASATRLSRGLEIIAAQVANEKGTALVPDSMDYRIEEDEYRLAFLIRVDRRTQAIEIVLDFQDTEGNAFSAATRRQSPQPVMNTPLRPDRGELPPMETAPRQTPLEVARALFGADGSGSPNASPPGGKEVGSERADSEETELKQELMRIDEELEAAGGELVAALADAALDVAGIVDPTPISDGLAAIRDLSRGDYLGAGLSALSGIPWLGDALAKPIKGARVAKRIAAIRKLIARLRSQKERLLKLWKQKRRHLPASGNDKAFHRPKQRSEAEKQWRKEYDRARAEKRAGSVDQPLEPTNPKKASHGHGHADHGAQTTAADQAKRVETGETPGGRTTPKGRPASRFRSPEAEVEALGRARRKLDADGPPKFDSVTGEPNRRMYDVETTSPGGFGTRHIPKKDAAGKALKPYAAEADPSILRRARVIFEYVPSKDAWHPVTYFPVP
jgi:hypothetical protein